MSEKVKKSADLFNYFLIKKALINLHYTNILDFKQVTNIPDNISSSAFAVAGALYYNHLKKK